MIQKEPYPGILTATERDLGCWVVNGDDQEPGDVLMFLGRQYRIDKLPAVERGANTLLEQCYPEDGIRLIVAEGREFTWAVPREQHRTMNRWETAALVAVMLLACGGAALWARDAMWCADLNGELHTPREGRAVCIVNDRVVKP